MRLTIDEIHMGAIHAVKRRCAKLAKERGDRAQNEQSSWDNEIGGALAEMAWCKLTDTYWSGVGGLRFPDSGSGVEVRWTHLEGRGGLIVYEGDDRSSVYVLAEGYAPEIRFVGWLNGADAAAKVARVGNIDIVPRDRLCVDFSGVVGAR